MTIRFGESAHYYSKDGAPRYEATLREARKEILYPSITTIDKDQFTNDFLQRWKMNELALAACGNPRMPHESDDDYANRIYDVSLTKARDAAQFGKALHDAVEHYPQMPMDPTLLPWFLKFEKWWIDNGVEVIAREKVVLDHDLGLAGRLDLLCNRRGRKTVVDFKTQGVKTDDKGRKKPNFYASWPRQLAFYNVAEAKEYGLIPELSDCVSLVIDSNDNGEIYEKVWTKEEILSAYEDVIVATWAWQKSKKYWPSVRGRWGLTHTIPIPS